MNLETELEPGHYVLLAIIIICGIVAALVAAILRCAVYQFTHQPFSLLDEPTKLCGLAGAIAGIILFVVWIGKILPGKKSP